MTGAGPIVTRRIVLGAGVAMTSSSLQANSSPGVFPPWQGGANNDVEHRGLEFTVPANQRVCGLATRPSASRVSSTAVRRSAIPNMRATKSRFSAMVR